MISYLYYMFAFTGKLPISNFLISNCVPFSALKKLRIAEKFSFRKYRICGGGTKNKLEKDISQGKNPSTLQKPPIQQIRKIRGKK